MEQHVLGTMVRTALAIRRVVRNSALEVAVAPTQTLICIVLLVATLEIVQHAMMAITHLEVSAFCSYPKVRDATILPNA